jgi:hypothetical protein
MKVILVAAAALVLLVGSAQAQNYGNRGMYQSGPAGTPPFMYIAPTPPSPHSPPPSYQMPPPPPLPQPVYPRSPVPEPPSFSGRNTIPAPPPPFDDR